MRWQNLEKDSKHYRNIDRSLQSNIVIAVFAIGAFYTLWKRKYRQARLLVAGQVIFIIGGRALSQFPNIIEPNISIYEVAAPPITLTLTLIALGIGSLILFPSFYYLFWVFKTEDKNDDK